MAVKQTKRVATSDAKVLGNPAYPGFALVNSPFYLLAQANARYVFAMERSLKAVGMDLPSWRVLMVLHEKTPSSISEIAARSFMRLSTMTRVSQRLAKRGLVELAPNGQDARVTDVHLTHEGELAVEKIRQVASGIYGHAFDDFNVTDVARLLELLARLGANLERAV